MATVSQMETRARAKVDQDDSNFPTSAQYMEFLSDGAACVWGKLIAAGWEPGRTSVTPTITGASSYLVSVSPEAVLDVFRVEGTTRARLRRLKPENAAAALGDTGKATQYDLYWDPTTGLRVKFHPTPSDGTYEIWYIPQFTRFSASTDAWYGPARSDDYIVTYAALQAASKEGSIEEAQWLTKQLAEIEEDMVRRLPWMDMRSPGTVRDVYPAREVTTEFYYPDTVATEGEF